MLSRQTTNSELYSATIIKTVWLQQIRYSKGTLTLRYIPEGVTITNLRKKTVQFIYSVRVTSWL